MEMPAELPDEPARFVVVGELAYPERMYFEALTEAGFEQIERAFTASSPRAVLRAMSGLKTEAASDRVRRAACARLTGGLPEAGLVGVVVARFPAPT